MTKEHTVAILLRYLCLSASSTLLLIFTKLTQKLIMLIKEKQDYSYNIKKALILSFETTFCIQNNLCELKTHIHKFKNCFKFLKYTYRFGIAYSYYYAFKAKIPTTPHKFITLNKHSLNSTNQVCI